MIVLAIDPGNIESAYVLMDDHYKITDFGKIENNNLLDMIPRMQFDSVAIEMVASYGMAVGASVFDTCVWVGRFTEAVKPCKAQYIYRKDVKMNLCGQTKAKDSNIRQALIDRFAKHDFKNGKGTKQEQDWFYGFKADIWQSYACGVTLLDKYLENKGVAANE
jgi:hypothetical protein